MDVGSRIDYAPGDPVLIKNIVSQLKSQGVFDQFRKECISDVDTKPAYQNLCHRVDGQIESYLSKVKWGSDLNKNQLREHIRKYVNECHFVEPGISRIVDQLVNPRINTVLVPKVEDIVYSYLGIERPPEEAFNNTRPSYDARLSNRTSPYWNADVGNEKAQTNGSVARRSRKSDSAVKYDEDTKLKSPFSQNEESNKSANQSSVAHGDNGLISPSTIKKESAAGNECFFESRKENKPESFTSLVTDHRETIKLELDACSNIDSDEDDMSPPFELHVKSDVDSADSDFSLDVPDPGSNAKPEQTATAVAAETENETDKLYRNLERICGEESMDSVTSSYSHRATAEKCRKLSASLDIPKTPTINYETSDDGDDNYKKNNSDGSRHESTDAAGGPSEADIPDTSNFDSLTRKIVEDNQEVPSTPGKVSTDDNVRVPSTPIEELVEKDESKEKDQGKEKDQSKDKDQCKERERDDKESSKHKKNSDSKSGDSSDKHRDRKHSDRKREKDRSKSDRHESRSDKDRKNRDKDRSNQDSKGSSKDKKEGARTESEKNDVSSDRKSQKSHSDDKKSKDRDSKRDSGKVSSSSDKSKSSRSKSDDSKDDRKKRSSSKHETDKEKNRTSSSSSDKSKSKKEESSDLKKSKSQCNTDEKKARTDRRSSDRDSNGPSSSSHHSTHRSSSRTDKEKHSDKPRHSSSVSSSHKSKKNTEADCGRTEDGTVTTASNADSDMLQASKTSPAEDVKDSVELASEEELSLPSAEKQLFLRVEDLRNPQPFVAAERITDDEVTTVCTANEPTGGCEVSRNEAKVAEKAKKPEPKIETKSGILKERKLSDSSVTSARTDSSKTPPTSKSKSLDLGELNIKKPKIAKNASDIFRIMELRKQYKEQMRLMQQQGKENANSDPRKDMLPLDREEKTALGQLSPVNTIALKESVDNYIGKTLGRNGANVGKNEQIANSIIETITDVKLRIRRIDSCYELVNGSCVVNDVNGSAKVISENDSLIGDNNNSDMSNHNIKGECGEAVTEREMNREQNVTTVEKAVAGDREDDRSLSYTNPADDVQNQPPSAGEHKNSDVKNAILLESTESNPAELGTAAVGDVTANKAHETRLIGDAERGKTEDELEESKVPVLEAVRETPFDIVRTQVVAPMTPVIEHCPSAEVCSSPDENSADVRYFDPPELKTSFLNFVAKRIKECEEMYLQNFSIHIRCPERHDNVFRSEMGAVVRRKGRPDLLPSPVKYNSEIISNKSGDDRGIMLRIKKTFDLDLSPSSQQSCKRLKVGSVAENDISPLSPDASNSLVSCDSTPGSIDVGVAVETPGDISTGDSSVKSEKMTRVPGTTAKRKTLGIKRKVSSGPKLSTYSESKQDSPSMETKNHLPPKMMKLGNLNRDQDLAKVDNRLDVLSPNPGDKNVCMKNSFQRHNGSFCHLSTSEDHKSDDATKNSLVITDSPAAPTIVTPKNQRRGSVQKPITDQGSKEAASKRKQFYYDEGDLYKPRPTFLSSRRSRPFNSENIN